MTAWRGTARLSAMNTLHRQPSPSARAASRRYMLAGHDGRGARAQRRAAYRRHPDRQSRRHHAARARDAGRRRPDRLRGHPRHPQAARPLRHRDAADALSRPQCGDRRGRRCCSGSPKARPSRWFPMPARRLFPIRASSWCARRRKPDTCGHRAARRLGAARGADGRRPADRSVSLRRLPAAERGRAPHPHRRTRAAFRRRWCCSRPARGSRRRSPISRRARRRARPRCAASSPSCTRRSAAAISATLAQSCAATANRAAKSCWSIAPPARRRQPSAGETDALLRAGAGARLAEGRRRRSRRRDRAAAARGLSARAGAGQERREHGTRIDAARRAEAAKPTPTQSRAAAGARRGIPARPVGGEPRGDAADRQGLSDRWRGAGRRRSARSTSSPGAAATLVFVEVKARATARRRGGGGDRTQPAAHHRRRRILARAPSGGRASAISAST